MPSRYDSNGPAHAHSVAAESRDRQDRQSGAEHSRQALEHDPKANDQPFQAHQGAVGEHNVADFEYDDIAPRAYQLWEARGCPDGSPDEDWFVAVRELQAGRPSA